MNESRTKWTSLILLALGLVALGSGCDEDALTDPAVDAEFRGCSQSVALANEDPDDEQADNFDTCADACDAMHEGQVKCFEIYNQPSSCYAWCQDRFIDGDWGAEQAQVFATCVSEQAMCYMSAEYLCGL